MFGALLAWCHWTPLLGLRRFNFDGIFSNVVSLMILFASSLYEACGSFIVQTNLAMIMVLVVTLTLSLISS